MTEWLSAAREVAVILVSLIIGGLVMLWIQIRKQRMSETELQTELEIRQDKAELEIETARKKAQLEMNIAEEQAMQGGYREMGKWLSNRMSGLERKLDITNQRLAECESDRSVLRVEAQHAAKRIKQCEDKLTRHKIEHPTTDDSL